jgi:predicted DNA-binding WGR domain protein
MGRFSGESGLLWAIFVDAKNANGWDTRSEPKAFRMVETRAARPIVDVGGERGLVAEISTSGQSLIWSSPDGFVSCDYFPADHVDTRKSSDTKKIAPHVLTAPTSGRSRTLGALEITSGVVAMLLPHVKPKVTPAVLAKAKKAQNATLSDGLCLVPLAPGVYELVMEDLGEYRFSEGLFTRRLSFVRKGTFRKTEKPAKTTPAKQAPTPKSDPHEHRRTRMLKGGGVSVLFEREGARGKEFVLVVRRNRVLSTESGRWGEEGTWSKETLPSNRAAQDAFWDLEKQLRRKRYTRAKG